MEGLRGLNGMINSALKGVSHQIMSNNELFHYNPVWVIKRLICQCRIWQVPAARKRGLCLPQSVCHNAPTTAFFHTKSHLYCTGKEREMLLFFSKKHTTNALGHDLSLLFSARSPTLKTWSFWILIKHRGTSQGVLAWQRKLLWFMYYFVVPAWSLPVMRGRGDEWTNQTGQLFLFVN